MAPRSRTKPSAPVEEDIDLEVSDTSEDDGIPNPAPPKTRATRDRAANAPGDETTHVAPIIKPVVKSNRALDVDLIFDRGKGEPSVCKFCK